MDQLSLEDRLEIQALAARYAYLCDTAQYENIDALFTADGVFDESILGTPVATGTAALKELFVSAGGTAAYMIHINSNHLIHEATASTAHGTCHLHCEAGLKDGKHLTIYGYYVDEYVKVGGKWRFKSRKLVAIAPIALQ